MQITFDPLDDSEVSVVKQFLDFRIDSAPNRLCVDEVIERIRRTKNPTSDVADEAHHH